MGSMTVVWRHVIRHFFNSVAISYGCWMIISWWLLVLWSITRLKKDYNEQIDEQGWHCNILTIEYLANNITWNPGSWVHLLLAVSFHAWAIGNWDISAGGKASCQLLCSLCCIPSDLSTDLIETAVCFPKYILLEHVSIQFWVIVSNK